jgi:hypothetical protein
MREIVATFRGREIKTTRDGFVVVFDGAARAIRCARRMVDSSPGDGISIRAAVHTGEFEFVGDDMVGVAVHEAARVAAVATEGEVLVSAVTRDLAGGVGLSFEDRGEHELRGFDDPPSIVRGRKNLALGGSGVVTVRTDPEGNETKELFDLVDLEGVHVLEIGAGDGRLTWRYAERTAHVTAVEPFEGSVSRAKEQLRETDLPIEFRHVAFEDFAAGSDPEVFDVALLSWSLC